MKLIGNIIWFVFSGFINWILWTLSGVILCITIIGIPFGVQCFKIASYVVWPFKKNVIIGEFGVGGLIGNILWLIIFGWELSVYHLIAGALFCITIVGIPFGKQHFKFAKLALFPFGAKIRAI